MPPGMSRFASSQLSASFGHVPAHHMHQQPHPQQQHQQGLPHPSFGAAAPASQAQNLGFFTGHNQNTFQGNASLGNALRGGTGFVSPTTLAGGPAGAAFASHEAQMRFAQGALLQQEATFGRNQDGPKIGQRIREVWRGNLHQEMDLLRSLVTRYPFVSMDTEFPGIIARPMGDFPSKASYHYQTVRCNVDLLKIIQLGITLFSKTGDVPPAHLDTKSLDYQPKAARQYTNGIVPCPCTWTFNFQFSLDEDMYNDESIRVLKKSGADFEKHATQGIDPEEFASLLTTSGLTFDPRVHWISFHSGYDFAYLVKLLSCQHLPGDEESYRKQVELYFPRLLDVKYLWRMAISLARKGTLGSAGTTILNNIGTKSGLQDLADELGCQRIGVQHSAGSDAWLTGTVFWEMRRKMFDDNIPDDMNGQMWGLTGVGPPASSSVQAAALAAQGVQNLSGGYQGLNGQGAMNYHMANNATGHRPDGPSTPTSHAVGLATTPGPQAGPAGLITPGGPSGAFSDFRYGAK